MKKILSSCFLTGTMWNSDRNDVESDFYNAGVKYSARVTDKDTLSFLDNQETITTYKTMQIVDGKLYPPMAARIDGKHEDYSVLGVWEQATEHPELIKGNGKFKLDKGKGQGSIDAAYNPYMHSSNLVINDQFTGAYTRDNLVTVECEVPVSELTSGYHAQYAKDSVGWHAWHTGTVAGAIRKAKGIERQVFLSRWIKPVRIVTDAEVASMYRDLLDGTDISVPDNVVTPSLLSELKKAGVKIGESGRVKINDTLAILSAKSDKDTDEDILKDVTHGFANDYLKEKVNDDEISLEDAADLLKYIGHDDPDGVVAKWVFQASHPDIDSNKITSPFISAYNQRGDISEKAFMDAYWFAISAEADKDKDGKSINGSKKAKIIKYIQSIPGLTFEQQKRLYILLDVGSLKDTPWE